jgi:ABC-type transport system involved in multi-copper enzyme maturation permease subunit
MIGHWWTQILAVIRLEMRKTFFARRGLWIYLLAVAPVLIWAAHAIDVSRNRDSQASGRAVSSAALESIQTGMSVDEVIAKLGEPVTRTRFRGRRVDRQMLGYTDGQTNYTFVFDDDELYGINRRETCSLPQDSVIFATVFQFFFLRLAIFFGCVGVFMNLFRGEMIDKSLHFYLLAPMRREVLLVGKYLAGLLATVVIFTGSAALQLLIFVMHFAPSVRAEYLNGPGWSQIGAYLGVTALACLGYGSVFLAAGLLFRNPIVPAAAVLLWEGINPFLPAALKKISVIFYLQSLCPVVAPPGRDMSPVLALLVSNAEPTPAALAVAGLFLVTLAVLAIAARKARRLEINYSTD